MYLDGQAEQVVHEVRDEVGILEIGQDAQVHYHAQGCKGPARLFILKPGQSLCREEVIDDDEDQQGQEHAAGLVVEEQRHGKEVAVAQQYLGMEEGKDGENQCEERPEIELGEQQRVRLVKGEQVHQKIPYDIPEVHLPYPSIMASNSRSPTRR